MRSGVAWLAALLLALALLSTLPPLASAASASAKAVVYPDGSLRLEARLSGLATKYPPLNLSLRISFSPTGFNATAIVYSPRPADQRIVNASLRASGSYTYLGNASRYSSRTLLFEDLGREGWIRVEANVSSLYNYTALRKVDRVRVSISALGPLSSIVTASTLISREGIERQLRSSGITWVNVTEARATVRNGVAILTFVIVTDLRGLAKHVARARGISLSEALKGLAPPRASLRYWMSMNSSARGTSARLVIEAVGDAHQVALALKDMSFLPSVGASGVAIGVSMVRGLYVAMDVANYLSRDLEVAPLRVEPSEAWVNISVGSGGYASITIYSPRLSTSSSNPLDTLRAIALALYAVSRDSDLPPWVSRAARDLLNSRIELVPASKGVALPARSVTLSELLRSARTVTVSISLPRPSAPTSTSISSRAIATATGKSLGTTTTIQSASTLLTSAARVSTSSARGVYLPQSVLLWISVALIAVSLAAIAVAIALMRRRY